MAQPDQMAQSDELDQKRLLKPDRTTFAAKYNATVMHSLTAALKEDPELDMASWFSPGYSKTLQSHKVELSAFSQVA